MNNLSVQESGEQLRDQLVEVGLCKHRLSQTERVKQHIELHEIDLSRFQVLHLIRHYVDPREYVAQVVLEKYFNHAESVPRSQVLEFFLAAGSRLQ